MSLSYTNNMKPDYWQPQTKDEPLFSDLQWSRPENKQHAGKLLIIGGNLYGFAAPAEAYSEALKSRIGEAKVLLPNALSATLGKTHLETAEFAPSTPSGSFTSTASSEAIFWGNWADGVLVAGDIGRNSETVIMVEKFLTNFGGTVTLTKDAADAVLRAGNLLRNRTGTCLVLSLAQLQRLATNMRYIRAITFGMNLLQLVDWLHQFGMSFRPYIIVKHHNYICVAVNGQVSTTELATDLPIWRVKTAARASVWWLQNPAKPFEALTTAAHEMIA